MSTNDDNTAAVDGTACVQAVAWNDDGLVPAVAQDAATGEVLMLAWMNRDALMTSINEGYATYWSRSRASLWRKGESSGHTQRIVEMRLDCDGDTVLLRVEQNGGVACHTGHRSCFYQVLEHMDAGPEWITREAVVKNPDAIYS